ncbi:unnamed protein product [Cuscuta campestris]|uniref:Dof zinc finger protein n=1 Tax=Cuscuta campestris TaxID=132261 RepID=A0A484LJI1_9ASTE|nr:unnamed protein product [Cuscuta campestris]
MQEIHSIGGGGGGGGRFFGGGGERRLRPNQHHTPPSLKCPRCDSLNTKFCYFNNYNLSQPRHFCKSCRRYWTKGGVLRNVPVGGGCRKSKRSNKPKPSPSSAPARKPSSRSSSESSGLTGTAAAVPDGNSDSNTAEVASTCATTALSAPTVSNYQNSGFFLIPASDPPPVDNPGNDQNFPDIGIFTNMMGFDDDIPPAAFQYPLVADNNPGSKWAIPGPGKMVGPAWISDRTDQIDFMSSQNRVSDVGLATLDWNTGGGVGDPELFDLTGAVDQTYWSQTHWG